jgi:hypothetical protein
MLFSAILLLDRKDFNSVRWISARPYLLFAIVHGIHLVELLLYVSNAGIVLKPVRLLGGFIAYAFIFLMPFLAYMKTSGRLTEKLFFRIELFFSAYVWFIFFMAYLPRVFGNIPNIGGSYWEHVVLFVTVLFVGGFALFQRLKLRAANTV